MQRSCADVNSFYSINKSVDLTEGALLLIQYSDMTVLIPALNLAVLIIRYHTWLFQVLHCKKRLVVFPSPGGMSLTKLSLAGTNLIIPGQGEFGK